MYAACGGAPRDDGTERTDPLGRTTGNPVRAAAQQPDSATPFFPGGCVRGGSTPAEVRAALGEPDSIVGGWWIYGRDQIQFAYGTVQDFIDGGNLVRCGPAKP